MTPDEFKSNILPVIIKNIHNKCICHNNGIRSLMSFSFADYGIGPVALADSEILIQKLLRSSNENYDKTLDNGHGWEFKCKTCGSILREHYDEYSINLSQSYIEYTKHKNELVPYLVGFYGFRMDQLDKIHDYKLTDDVNYYLSYINAAQQADAPEPLTRPGDP